MTSSAVHPLVSQILNDLTSAQINKLCRSSKVPRMTVNSWIRQRRTPLIDLLSKFAKAAGYEMVLKPIQKGKPIMVLRTNATTSRLRIFDRNGRTEVQDGGKLAGYVEDDTLFGFDRDGYCVEIGGINHRSEIIGKFEGWRRAAP